ncbi:MAG: NADH-quinone oxidoreductase subunit C [Burkholderiales bacterium]|nr:NADH-quinone oxidoreductase subunit C [Burkholderiales bacterium]
MTSPDWIALLAADLSRGGASVAEQPAAGLAPARLVTIDADRWGELARSAAAAGCRWAAGWGEDAGDAIVVNVVLARSGTYLVARTQIDRRTPVLPSHTPAFPVADRPERHTQDMLGVVFTDHPDARRWTRHQAWTDAENPLRKDFPAAGNPPPLAPGDHQYKFFFAHGPGVYEIPVGPVHAGIIEPGHFRFQAVGETVLNLEERLGYVHKGIEKIAEGRDAAGLARLAARVSGDTTVAHAWAACMAMEQAAALAVPERALWLRALMCERERVANHLGDIGAILNDIAFTFGFYQFMRLREEWTRLSRDLFGHRFMMDCVVPGGVAADLEPAQATRVHDQITGFRAQLDRLLAIVREQPSVEDRLLTAGALKPEHAAALGCTGYVGRASGVDYDVRRDAPYPPYDRLRVEVPVYRYGDIAARVRVRAEETQASFDLIDQLLAGLPAGAIRGDWAPPAAGAEGLGIVEGWRGEIVTHVRFAEGGRIARFFPRDPSWTTWPALELLIHDNIVPDFPVCNKSVNGSYSGHDL